MTDAQTQSGAYCSDLLRHGDEDRWLASQYAAPSLRPALHALYAFQIELRRIPAAVSEPPLGEIRLQWWREAIDEIRCGAPRAHPVIEAMARAGLAAPAYEASLETVIDAAARPFYGEGFLSIEDLEAWLEAAEGGFDALAVALAGGDEAMAAAAANAGAAFALAREGERIAPTLGGALVERAQTLYRENTKALSGAPPEISPALLHLALTPHYLRRSAKAFPIGKRLTLFAAMAFSRF